MPLDLVKIKEIVSKAFAKGKDYGLPKSAVLKKKDEEDKAPLPEYYPFYKQIVENVEVIMTHAVKGFYPGRLFHAPSPNQTEKEAEYIKNNYKQSTLPVYIDYMSTISRAFHDNNWDIDYVEQEKERDIETFRAYVEREMPMYGSLEAFIKDIMVNAKTLDAMALLCIRPYEVITKVMNDETIVDDTQKIRPFPVIYASRQVVDYKEGEWYAVEFTEKSLVDYGNTKAAIGKIYDIIDDKYIWRATQIGKYIDGIFQIEVLYPHDYGRVPARRLGGVPMYLEGNNQLIFFSPFLFATDLLDRALLNDQYLQISINYCTFPYRVMLGDVCQFVDVHGNNCDDGLIVKKDNSGHYKCPKCDGNGLVSRVSRMGQMLLRPASKLAPGDSQLKVAPMQYISPSTDTLKFLEDKVDKDIAKARRILHLKEADQQVKFQENTATASNNDLKATYAFVKTVSDQVFDLYAFALETIGRMRYGASFIIPKLTYPKSFDFATEADYLREINESIKAGLAPAFIQQILLRYVRAMYGDDENIARVFALIVASDRLLTITSADIASKLSRGTVARWEEILHTSALTMINGLVREDAAFLQKDLKDQITALVEKAKEKETAVSIQTERDSIIDDIAGGA